jgi:hypothetical protein
VERGGIINGQLAAALTRLEHTNLMLVCAAESSTEIEVSAFLNESPLAPTLEHQDVSGRGTYLVTASLK